MFFLLAINFKNRFKTKKLIWIFIAQIIVVLLISNFILSNENPSVYLLAIIAYLAIVDIASIRFVLDIDLCQYSFFPNPPIKTYFYALSSELLGVKIIALLCFLVSFIYVGITSPLFYFQFIAFYVGHNSLIVFVKYAAKRIKWVSVVTKVILSFFYLLIFLYMKVGKGEIGDFSYIEITEKIAFLSCLIAVILVPFYFAKKNINLYNLEVIEKWNDNYWY